MEPLYSEQSRDPKNVHYKGVRYVHVHMCLKYNIHILKLTSQMIRRNITYEDKFLIIPQYKAIVRHPLEYCIQAWHPYLRKYIDMLDKIQRRATKLIPGLRDLRYEERLKECGLTTLETRRLRGDEIQVFKILNGYENIDSNIFIEIKEIKVTRGHNYTLVKKQSRLDVRKYSFSQRTINVWNKLSTDCV